MASQLRWFGKEFDRQLKAATFTGLNRAGTFYHAKCREAVSVPNTGKRVKRKLGNGTYTIYPNPSQPGEAPRLRTGFGQKNILKENNKERMWVRVGVGANAEYMANLEVGTKTVARRPWMIPTLRDNANVIGKLAATGGKSEIKNT